MTVTLVDRGSDPQVIRYGSSDVITKTRYGLTETDITRILVALAEQPWVQWATARMEAEHVQGAAEHRAARATLQTVNPPAQVPAPEQGFAESYSAFRSQVNRYAQAGMHKSFDQWEAEPTAAAVSVQDVTNEAQRLARRGKWESYESIRARLSK